MDMGGGSTSGNGPLSSAGVNFSDPDQATNFLSELLNDDELKIIGNDYARYFWYGTAVVVSIASLFHWARLLVLHMRLRAASKAESQPARPKSTAARYLATITAIAREATYLQFTPTGKHLWFRIPPLGTIMLILTYLAFVLGLEFANNSVSGAQFWQARGVRAGWLAVAQAPLIILLVSKNNLITILTGVSVERLNVLHRWVARGMLLMAIFHFGFQMTAWSDYGLVRLEWSTDSCPPSGMAALAVLLWINLSTLAPFRNFSYEFFVLQHIVSFFGFIIAIMYHLPSTALGSRVYIYIPIGLYLGDRILRTVSFAFDNFRISRATLTALDGGVTRIRLFNKTISHWGPGSYVLLSIPRFGLVQAHPATIASAPRSHNGDMLFVLKSHKGFTKRIMASANNSTTALLPHSERDPNAQQDTSVTSYYALLSGPYGGSQSDFTAFDSVCLIAGSTGVTFTLALLQDISDRVALSGQKFPVRRVHFVWCIKKTSWINWVNKEITAAVGKFDGAGVKVEVSIYVTCADIFTDQDTNPKDCGCACDKSMRPCCCSVIEDGKGVREDDYINVKAAGSVSDTKRSTVSEKVGMTTFPVSQALEASKETATRIPILPCAAFYSGRPEVAEILTRTLDGADGESGVAVCGPIGLSTTVRNNVVRLSDQRAIHKGTGAQGCYLHVESFS